MKHKNILFLLIAIIAILSITLTGCSLFGGSGDGLGPGSHGGGEPNTDETWEEPSYHFDIDYEFNTGTCIAESTNYITGEHRRAEAECTYEVIEEPTFDTPGRALYTAVFDEPWAGTTTEEAYLKRYELEHVFYRRPTPMSEGNIEYYKGSNGKYYKDENHTIEITKEQTIIPIVIPTFVPAVKADYGVQGCIDHYEDDKMCYLKDTFGNFYSVSYDEVYSDELKGTVKIYAYGELQVNKEHYKKDEVEVTGKFNESNCTIKYYTDPNFTDNSFVPDYNKYVKENKDVVLYIRAYCPIYFKNLDKTIDYEYDKPFGEFPDYTLEPDMEFIGWGHEFYEPDCNIADICNEIGGTILYPIVKSKDFALFYRDLNEREVEVTGMKGNGDVVMPGEYYFGKKIVKIADSAFENNEKIKTCYLHNNIKVVGKCAFKNCKNLYVSVLDVETISDEAFNNVNSISFTNDSIIKEIGFKSFANLNVTNTEVNLPNLEKLESYAFRNSHVSSFNINTKLKYIGLAVFSLDDNTILNNTVLTRFTNSSDNVYFNAHDNCIIYVGDKSYNVNPIPGISKTFTFKKDMIICGTSPNISARATSIGAYAYDGVLQNNNIDTFTIPANISYIGEYAFNNCHIKAEKFDCVYREEPLVLSEGSFYGNNFKYITIFNFIKTVPTKSFAGNSDLHSIEYMGTEPIVFENNIVDEVSKDISVSFCTTFHTDGETNVILDPKVFENVRLFSYIGPEDGFKLADLSKLKTLRVLGDVTITKDIFKNSKQTLKTFEVGDCNLAIESGAFNGLNLEELIMNTDKVTCDLNAFDDSAKSLYTFHGPTKIYEHLYPLVNKNVPQTQISLGDIELFGNGSPDFSNLNRAGTIALHNGVYQNVRLANNTRLEEFNILALCTFAEADPFKKDMNPDLYPKVTNVNIAFNEMTYKLFTNFNLVDTAYQKINYSTGHDFYYYDYYGVYINDKKVATRFEGDYTQHALIYSDEIDECYAFVGDSKYISINVNGNFKFNDYIFYKNTSLQAINGIENITSTEIGNHSFEGSTALRNLTLKNNLTRIGDCAFKDSNIQSLTIPSTVTYVGENAFQNTNSNFYLYINQTQEYVETHWHKNWANGISGHIVYQ